MNRYYLRLLMWPLCILFCFSCSTPEKILARNYGLNKRVLEKRLIKEDAEGRETLVRRRKGFDIGRAEVSELKSRKDRYEKFDSLEVDVFCGPYPAHQEAVFYLRKLGVRQVPYADFVIVQFHQRFGISDALFAARMDTLLAQGAVSNEGLVSFLKNFPDEEEITVGTVLEIEQDNMEQLTPEARAFLLTAPAMAARKSEKAEFPNTTITEVLIKTKALVTFQHIDYARITVREPLKKEK